MVSSDLLSPEVEAWVRQHFAGVDFNHHLGMEITALAPGLCRLRMPYRPEWGQQHGAFHGGVMGTLSDSAVGHAALTLLPPGRSAVTVEYKINFLAAARGDWIEARAHIVKAGRTLQVGRAEVFAGTGDEANDAPCAEALVTYMALEP